jgi:hypothetical protein
MWLSNGKLMRPWIAGLLVLVLLALTGCAEVEVVDTTPAAATQDAFVSPLVAGTQEHNLAVLTVDFDPPLDYQRLLARDRTLTLLVAIENAGSRTEHDVTVRVQLSSPEDLDLLLTQGASVASIAPGEIKVVSLARLGEIPFHQAYYLEVGVDPVEGEAILSDNVKGFAIQIHQE